MNVWQRSAKKKVKKNVQSGIAHIQSTFNNTIVTITDVSGNVVAWSSAGVRGFKGSRKSHAVRRAARRRGRRQEGDGPRHALASRSSSRARARVVNRRCARCRRPGSRSRSSATSRPSRTTAAGRPSAAASDSTFDIEGKRLYGSLYRIRLPSLPPREHEAVLQGRSLLHRQVRLRASCRTPPASTARRASARLSNYGEQLREKQKVKRIYGIAERQFRGYYYKALAPQGRDRREPARCSSSGAWTTSSTASASPAITPRRVSWCATATSSSTARRVNIPSYLVRAGDVVSVIARRAARSKRIEESLGRGRPSWRAALARARQGEVRGHGQGDAGPRRLHHADPRAADRRALLEVSEASDVPAVPDCRR